MGLLDDAIKEHLELKRRRGADAGEISRLESEALGPVRRSADGVPDLSDTFEPARDVPIDVPEAPDAGLGATTPAPAPSSPSPDDVSALGPLPEASAPKPPASPPPLAYEPPSPPPAPAAQEPSPAPAFESPPIIPPPTREAWMTDPDPDPDLDPFPEPEPEPEPTGLFSRLRGGRRAKHDREPPPAAAGEPAADEPTADVPPPPARPSYEPPPPPVQHEPDIVPADDEPDGEDLLEETPEFLEETPEHDRLWFEQRPPRDFNFDD